MKFAGTDVIVYLIKIRRYHVDSFRIAYKQYIVPQMLRTQMDMKNRTVIIYDQFRRGMILSSAISL